MTISYLNNIIFIICIFGIHIIGTSCNTPYYPNPWSFYALVNFPTSNSSYIAKGYLDGVSYREDEHGIGYYYQNYFVYNDKRVYHVKLDIDDNPIDCTPLPYLTLPFSPTMFSNASYINTTIIQDIQCDMYKGEWNNLKYEMCHKPNESAQNDNSNMANGYMIYFLTTYKPPFALLPTPLSYTFYDFKSGLEADFLVNENDLIPPSICFSH